MLLSVIIPTFNRSSSLEITLRSIMNLDIKADLEVIVVDNGSTDNTKELCGNFIGQKVDLRYVYDSEPGLLTGRHRGAQEASGDIFCFLDDDVVLDNGWVNAIVDCSLRHPDADLFTGPCLPHYEVEPPAWLDDFWHEEPGVGKFCSWLSLIDLGENEKIIDPNLVWGLNFIIRKSAFEELGGFHPDTVPTELQMFQGDGETGLTIKAAELGKKAVYHPGILLHHQVPGSRLAVEYFGKRAFFQGVCDSYSDLRKGKAPLTYSDIFIESAKEVGRKLFGRQPGNDKPRDVKMVRELTRKEYNRGYKFHQYWFRKSPLVREWVFKDNYVDYRLPVITSPT